MYQKKERRLCRVCVCVCFCVCRVHRLKAKWFDEAIATTISITLMANHRQLLRLHYIYGFNMIANVGYFIIAVSLWKHNTSDKYEQKLCCLLFLLALREYVDREKESVHTQNSNNHHNVTIHRPSCGCCKLSTEKKNLAQTTRPTNCLHSTVEAHHNQRQ